MHSWRDFSDRSSGALIVVGSLLKDACMTQTMLCLHLEPVTDQPYQYLLSWQDVNYLTTARFEHDPAFNDLLRAPPK
jgi:hypothetical protein